MEEGRPLDRFRAYLKTFQRDIHVKEGIKFDDNELIVPAALTLIFIPLLHKTQLGQFGMKAPVEIFWWPRLYREIYQNGKNCAQCRKTVKNLKVILGTNNTQKLPVSSEYRKEVNLYFAGALDKNWGTSKLLLLCIDRFLNFPRQRLKLILQLPRYSHFWRITATYLDSRNQSE